MLERMTQSTSTPAWAKLFKVTEVIRWNENSASDRAWFQYTLESDYSKMVGRRFGTSAEVRDHANNRVAKLNERVLGAGTRSIVIQKTTRK